MGPVQAVRPAFDDDEAAAPDQFVGALPRGLERDNPVRIAMEDKGWHFNQGQVVAEVGQP